MYKYVIKKQIRICPALQLSEWQTLLPERYHADNYRMCTQQIHFFILIPGQNHRLFQRKEIKNRKKKLQSKLKS